MISGTRGRTRTCSGFTPPVSKTGASANFATRVFGATEGTRTLDLLIDSQALFQLSYDRVVKPAGIEPALSDRESDVLPLDDGSIIWLRSWESNPGRSDKGPPFPALVGQPGVEPGRPV